MQDQLAPPDPKKSQEVTVRVLLLPGSSAKMEQSFRISHHTPTADDRKPARPNRYYTTMVAGVLVYMAMQDFYHQQYHPLLPVMYLNYQDVRGPYLRLVRALEAMVACFGGCRQEQGTQVLDLSRGVTHRKLDRHSCAHNLR